MENYQKLLCHFDTDVQDDSENAQVLTASGNAAIAATAKFGAGSLQASAGTDFVTIDDSDDWNFGTNDFTIDCWWYKDTLDFTADFFDQQVDASNRVRFYVTSDSLRFNVTDGGSSLVALSGAFSGSLDTWAHVAVTRRGSNWKIYKDGTVINSVTASITVPSLAADPVIKPVAGSGIAYLDELRVLNGMAAWDAAFNAPTIAWMDAPTARIMIEQATAFLAEFGEVIQYIPSGGTARSIKAIVDRDPIVRTAGSAFGAQLTITVANDPSIGITPDEADAGADLIAIPTRLGGPVDQRPIKFHRYQDQGMIEFEVM